MIIINKIQLLTCQNQSVKTVFGAFCLPVFSFCSWLLRKKDTFSSLRSLQIWLGIGFVTGASAARIVGIGELQFSGWPCKSNMCPWLRKLKLTSIVGWLCKRGEVFCAKSVPLILGLWHVCALIDFPAGYSSPVSSRYEPIWRRHRGEMGLVSFISRAQDAHNQCNLEKKPDGLG